MYITYFQVRWVVESANARIKSWRYLANVLPTNQVPYIKDYICIVCALANKYLPPLATGITLNKNLYLRYSLTQLLQIQIWRVYGASMNLMQFYDLMCMGVISLKVINR